MKKPSGRRRLTGYHELNKQVSLVDQLLEFERFREEVLPLIYQDWQKGLSQDELYQKYSALVAAKALSQALTEPDIVKATPLMKDVLDRSGGRATEKKQIEHKFKNMKDEEIDAVLKTQLEELESQESDD